MKLEYSFEASVKLSLRKNEAGAASSVERVAIDLKPSRELDRSAYINDDPSQQLLTKAGAIALVKTFTQGLIAALHASEDAGYIDIQDGFKDVIEDLTRGVNASGKIVQGGGNGH